MRHHLKKKLLRYKTIKSLPVKFPKTTKEEVEAYESHHGDFITPENFRIDFVRAWKKFAMNVEAREFFIVHFLESVRGGSYMDPVIPQRFLTPKWVGKALDAHMPHLRSEFKKYAKTDKTEKDLEKEKKVKIRKRRAARQHTVRLGSGSDHDVR